MAHVTEYVLGIDGGGTRTRAALVDLSGGVLGLGESSGSNVHHHGADAVARAIRAAVAAAHGAAASPPHAAAVNPLGPTHDVPPRAACLALAGVVTDDDVALARDAAARSGVIDAAAHLVIHNDGAAAVAGAHLGAAGVVLIAGTGSACYARDASGSIHRIGGWGWLLGDEGSGAWLGREALVAITHAADGRGPATALTAPLLHALGCRTPDDLLHRVHAAGLDRAGFAALAPQVLAIASERDAVADAIVERGVEALAACVQTALKTIGQPSAPLALVGGVATHPAVAARIAARLASAGSGARLVAPALPPAFGAAALALEAIAPLSDVVWWTLRQSAAEVATRQGGAPA